MIVHQVAMCVKSACRKFNAPKSPPIMNQPKVQRGWCPPWRQSPLLIYRFVNRILQIGEFFFEYFEHNCFVYISILTLSCAMIFPFRLFDLSSTCGQLGNDPSTTSSCGCADAEEKINNGMIQCGVDECPEDCAICQFCLYELNGCVPEMMFQ